MPNSRHGLKFLANHCRALDMRIFFRRLAPFRAMRRITCVVTSSYAAQKDEIKLKPTPPRIGRRAKSSREPTKTKAAEPTAEDAKDSENGDDDMPTKPPNMVLYRRFLSRMEEIEAKKQNFMNTLAWDRHQWLETHGKADNVFSYRHRVRMLRNWFELLDTDGSGEVGLDELGEPLVSTGVAGSREVRR